MMRQRVFLATTLWFLGGCAAVVHGPYQEVRIDSIPSGATATLSPMSSERGPLFLDDQKDLKVTTPAIVRLKRDNTYRIEVEMPGYKPSSTQLVSSYDWLWAPISCGPCEAIGELPTFDMKDHALPVRFAEAAFYEYPRGFFRAWGHGLRIFSPDALLGSSFKLKPKDSGFFNGWTALNTPQVTAKLEPAQ
jgi:hypothetical protein